MGDAVKADNSGCALQKLFVQTLEFSNDGADFALGRFVPGRVSVIHGLRRGRNVFGDDGAFLAQWGSAMS